jgi:hypothetical protein
LISNDQLADFYSTRVRQFPNLGRELEVDEELEAIFKYHQSDTSLCSEAGNCYNYYNIHFIEKRIY